MAPAPAGQYPHFWTFQFQDSSSHYSPFPNLCTGISRETTVQCISMHKLLPVELGIATQPNRNSIEILGNGEWGIRARHCLASYISRILESSIYSIHSLDFLYLLNLRYIFSGYIESQDSQTTR